MKKSIAIFIGLVLSAFALMGQVSQYPQTIPDKTVVGRIGSGTGSGPTQAIPFATLLAQLEGLTGFVSGPSTSTSGDLATWNNSAGTLLQDAGGGTVAGAYTWSGAQTWSAAGTFSSTAAFGSTTSFTGTMTGPDSGTWGSGGLSGTKLNNSTVGATTAAAGTFTTLTVNGQFIPAYGTPTIASGACGASTNGTLASGSTNQSGEVEIASATTTSCAVSFSTTLSSAPLACILFPANAGAAATGTTVARVSAISTGGFTITGSALASTNYYYHCF